MITRRALLQGAGGLVLGSTGLASYAVAVEPGFMLDVTRYRIAPRAWPAGLDLRVAIIADIHACEPWMPASRIRHIAEVANSLKPDLVVLLGDFNGGHRMVTGPVTPQQWGEALSVLEAPLGVHAILGNHDWWFRQADIRLALAQARIPVMENKAVLLDSGGARFWLAGIGDQLAFPLGRGRFRGVDDLPGTLAQVTTDDPVVLMVHEPDIFVQIPDRVSLTLAGHTHGGQMRLPGVWPAFVPSQYGARFAYGHINEGGRDLIVSGGLGTSIVPLRVGVPPEIVQVQLGA